MAKSKVANEIIKSTFLLTVDMGNGTVHTGTGFLFLFNIPLKIPGRTDIKPTMPVIVTNRHVLEGGVSARITIPAKRNKTSKPIPVIHTITNLQDIAVFHPNSEIDLAAFPVNEFLNRTTQQGLILDCKGFGEKAIPSLSNFEKFNYIEEIYVTGYPENIYDKENNIPTTRRGITASPLSYNFQNKPAFLIDIPIFPGSSGSPCYILEDALPVTYDDRPTSSIGTYLVGIVSDRYIKKVSTSKDTKIEENLLLGHVIKSSEIFALEAPLLTNLNNLLKRSH